MAYSSLPSNPTSHTVAQLLPKLHDADSDLRYMALNDLYHVLQTASPSLLMYENSLCAHTIDGLLNTLNDTNGEVQNMAVKCLGPFANKIPENVLFSVIDKISSMQIGNTVDHSIPALALRAIVLALPRLTPGAHRSSAIQEAHSAVSRVLIPRLIGSATAQRGRKDQVVPSKGMLEVDIETGQDSNAIDVLIEVVRGFGPMLQDMEIQALQRVLLYGLESERTNSVLRKKALSALSATATYFTDSLLSSFISRLIENFKNPHLTSTQRKLYITILGSLARSIPKRFGPYLKTLAPFVFSALTDEDVNITESIEDAEIDNDVNEIKEAALIALEGFLTSCSQNMLAYRTDCIDAGLRFLKYDPNIADEDEDEMKFDDDATSSDLDDFEEEDHYDDDVDDNSWKVRRCAARLIYTIINIYNDKHLLDVNTLFDKIAPALISRLKEREESVRLEILRTLSCLMRRTAKDVGACGTIYLVNINDNDVSSRAHTARKRRRGQSDTSMCDTKGRLPPGPTSKANSLIASAQTENHEAVTSISSEIGRALCHLLKKPNTSAIEQESIILLKNLTIVQPSALSEPLGQLVEFVLSIINSNRAQASASSGSSAASITVNSLRVHALQFISLVTRTQTTETLTPYLGDITSALAAAVKDRHARVCTEALLTVEHMIVVLIDQNRSPTISSKRLLPQLFDIIVHRINTGDADSEVRQSAVHALGLFMSRTFGMADFISREREVLGYEVLADRLRKETTRIASARAIEKVAVHLHERGDVSDIWLRTVSLELAAHLRKADRTLRFSSLQALKAIADNPIWLVKLDRKSMKEIMGLLLPLLSTNDPQLINTALSITASFVKQDAEAVASTELDEAICTLVRSSVAGSSLETLLALVRNLGESGTGKELMSSLLQDTGVGGHPDMMGKTVGTLLVSGSRTVGVTIDQFISELKETRDEQRKCLALGIIGQAGLLLGPSFSLKPDFFMTYVNSASGRVALSAAQALGRAGAGNISYYLPKILSIMNESPHLQYHLLHSLKEILQQENTHSDVVPFTKPLWDNIISASRTEDNRAIGAECLGRLAKIDPEKFLPQLQVCCILCILSLRH